MWDNVTLNFHSLGLIQYSLGPISYQKLPRDHNLPTLLNTFCVVSPFINKLIHKKKKTLFSNCMAATATAATAFF